MIKINITKSRVYYEIRHTIEWIDRKIVSRAIIFSHGAYYVLVYAEAHGRYRYAAGVIAVCMIVERLNHTHSSDAPKH